MNDIQKKSELENAIMDREYSIVDFNEEYLKEKNYTKIPVTEIAALGATVSPLITSFNTITQTISSSEPLLRLVNGSVSDLYKMGGDLVRGFVHDGSKFVQNGVFQIVESPTQIVSTTIPYNPAILFMAIALVNIDKKLGRIEETQKKILNRFDRVDRAELQGDMNLLFETLDGYKHWWNDARLIDQKLALINHIKKDVVDKISYYENVLNDDFIKDTIIHLNKDTDKIFFEAHRNFCHYQLAVYEYAFSSFLEILLSEHFDVNYLGNVKKWIGDYDYRYRRTYSKLYGQLENFAKESIEARALNVAAKPVKFIGNAIGKLDKEDKINLDDNLVDFGKKIDKTGQKKTRETMKKFSGLKDAGVSGFTQYIDTLNELHNKPVEILYHSNSLLVANLD